MGERDSRRTDRRSVRVGITRAVLAAALTYGGAHAVALAFDPVLRDLGFGSIPLGGFLWSGMAFMGCVAGWTSMRSNRRYVAKDSTAGSSEKGGAENGAGGSRTGSRALDIVRANRSFDNRGSGLQDAGGVQRWTDDLLAQCSPDTDSEPLT